MTCIRLPGLPNAAAEMALVKLWCRLEEHGVPTPKLDVKFGRSDTVHIALLFADSPEANTALQGWAEEVRGQVGESTPQHGAGAA